MENQYAIILKRVSSDFLRNIYIYEIEKIIKGKFYENEKIFIDEENNKIITFGNNKILNKSCKRFVSSILSENDLLNKYPSNSIKESLDLCYIHYQKFMVIVSCDYDNKNIKIVNIDKQSVINKITEKENKEENKLKEKYNKLKTKFGEDHTIITKEEYEILLDKNDINELKNYIKEIQENKILYQKKLEKSNNDWALIIKDSYINSIYNLDSIIKIKKFFISIKEKYVDNKEQQNISYVEYFCKEFGNLKYEILSISDISQLKDKLIIELKNIESSKKQFTFLKECGYPVDELVDLLSIYSNSINKMLKLDTVSIIHKLYEELYIETENLMVSAGITLDEAYNNKTFEIKKEGIDGKYINELFNYSLNEIKKMENIKEIKMFCIEMKYNFSAIIEVMLSKTDVDIEKKEINNIFDNIIFYYDQIINMVHIDKKEKVINEVYDCIIGDIKKLEKMYDEIIERSQNIDNELSIKEKKEYILKNIMKKIEEPYNELQSLVGLEDVKIHVDKLIKEKTYELVFENNKKNKRIKKYNYFFSGNPGTGKTTVAIILCEILAKLGCIKNNKIKKTTASDFIAGYVGQTAIKTKKIIQECKGGVIFIDEAYALSSTSSNSFTQDVFGELLPVLADGEISLILAGYNDEMKMFLDSNTGIKDRINNYFEFKDYTLDQLVEMFENQIGKYDYVVSDEAKEMFKEIIKDESIKKNFGNGRVVENFTNKILDSHEANMIDYDISDDSVITTLDIENARLKDTTYKEKIKKLGF